MPHCWQAHVRAHIKDVQLLKMYKKNFYMGGSRGKKGVRNPLKAHEKLGFLSKAGPDPLKSRKATKPEFNARPSLGASETPFKWRFTGEPMMGRFKWYLEHLSSHQKKVSKLDLL